MLQVFPSRSRYEELCAAGASFPVGICRPLKHEETSLSLYENHFLNRSYSFLLDSGDLQGKNSRYSFMGSDPVSLFKSKGNRIEEVCFDGEGAQRYEGDPFQALRKHLPFPPYGSTEKLPPFTGGAVGFLSYDLVRMIEKIPELARDDLDLPDICLIFTDQVLSVDHLKKTVWLTRWADGNTAYEETVQSLKKELDRISGAPKNHGQTDHSSSSGERGPAYSFSKEAFETAVIKAKNYIEAGDIFQLNLSLRIEQELKAQPWEIYKSLRGVNPSPFMGYLNFGEYQVVCGSPERLVKVSQGKAETRPIAGTRRKGKTAEEETRMERELMESAKEQAEHIMLVDLERNDLGKVCEYGSVKVDELLTIEKYSHVMHLVSNVKGKLHPRYDQISILRAMFPGGTITGCPKVRCMEIIEELEPVRRGLYTGSMGYLDYSGNMDLNIVIRSLFCKKTAEGTKGYLQAGAGIVADSIPEREYKESLNKAQAILRAMELAEKSC